MSTTMLRMQHTSLQFSDTKAQQTHDMEAIFEKGKSFPIKTGTESGPDNANYELIKKFAKEYNHVLSIVRENWVAIDRAIMKPNTSKKGSVFVTSNDNIATPMHDAYFATLGFTHIDPRVGRINVAGLHYPIKGATPGTPNYNVNKLYSRRVAEWMARVGKGSALAFANGDFNMDDRLLDLALGQNFTSMADLLGNHQNTGHGPIDAFTKYDRDGRVKANRFVVLDDREQKMFTDHYVLRGVWSIRHLKI